MEKIQETEVLSSAATHPHGEMARLINIAKSWENEITASNLLLQDSLLRFRHNGALMFHPNEFFGVQKTKAETAKKIEDIVTGI